MKTPRVDPVRQRARELMRRARELGEAQFDARENLVRVEVPGYPDRSGLSAGQASLEYAIALLETGGDAARANRIVRRVLDFQVRDESQVGYGNFRWYPHWTEVKDSNAVDFIVPSLVHLWQRHRARLESRTRKRLAAAWPLCVHALQRHRVDVLYTNIFVLGMLSRFLLARVLDSAPLERDARAQWDAFRKATAHFGIAEYNSPTYLPVCLYALERLWQDGPADLRAEFAAVLEYFYFEFAARYHAPTGFLAGAMSRAYPWDMEPNRSLTAVVAHRLWGAPCEPWTPFIVNWLLTDYVPPARIRRIALHKKWPLCIRADAPSKSVARTDSLLGNYTLGTQSGGWYGQQQVPLFLAIKGNPRGIAVYGEASVPFADRFDSAQRGSEATGVHWFEPTALAYAARHMLPKKPRSEDGFSHAVAVRWHLGRRDAVRSVRPDGALWQGSRPRLRGDVSLVLEIGEACLGLRFRLKRRESARLEWRGDELLLTVTLRPDAGKAVASDEVSGYSFFLSVTDRGTGSVSRVARRLARWNETARALEQPRPRRTWVLHDSPLARIRGEDLAEFFRGRAAPPWAG